eukprot:14635646-Alexandrium_andersonii.AAC.1
MFRPRSPITAPRRLKPGSVSQRSICAARRRCCQPRSRSTPPPAAGRRQPGGPCHPPCPGPCPWQASL